MMYTCTVLFVQFPCQVVCSGEEDDTVQMEKMKCSLDGDMKMMHTILYNVDVDTDHR